MLYYLFEYLENQFQFPGASLFNYISFRSAAAVITSLLISMLFGKKIIDFLKSKQIGESIRDLGLKDQDQKEGTPTMGGLIIIFSTLIPVLLFTNLKNIYIILLILTMIWMGVIGFIDDYLKVTRKDTGGLPGFTKFLIEAIISILILIWIINITTELMPTGLAFPFFKELIIDLGWFYIPFAAFVIVGTANSVNLTDGLDGLAIVPVMICAGVFLIISY